MCEYCGCYEESDKELDDMHEKIGFLIAHYTKQVEEERGKEKLEKLYTRIETLNLLKKDTEELRQGMNDANVFLQTCQFNLPIYEFIDQLQEKAQLSTSYPYICQFQDGSELEITFSIR